MSNWDSDIASLLDDVLQDREPVVTEPEPKSEPAPSAVAPQPNTVITTETGDATLESLLSDDGPEFPDGTEEEGFTPPTIETRSNEVTTVVKSSDEELADLPPIDNSMFSEPVEVERVPVPTFTDEELMNEIDIRNFGTLVSLTNRRWHAKVKDRKAAKDAANASDADGASFEAGRRLLVGADEKLRNVHSVIDAARTDHYRMTLPWSTVGLNDIGKRSGARLLPNTLFFEYAKVMGKHKADMIDALDKFVQAYPTLIAVAQQKLGKAFNQNEYPSPTVIGQYFDLSFDFEPIPSGGDYKGLQDAQVEKLAAALKRKTQLKLENAMQDTWQRLFEDVGHAAHMLGDPNATFHYTLFEKLKEHASMLKHLNVLGDKFIESVRIEVESKLTKADIKVVRKDDALRRKLGEDAAEIHTKMKEYADGKRTAAAN